jgi:hypothetical protein
MTDVTYSKPREMLCSWEFAEGLMNSDDAVVILAIATSDEDICAMTYWYKDMDVLPPWIIDRKAA